MFISRSFNFGAANIFAATDDDVFLAIHDEQIAVLVQIPDVARPEKSIGGKGITRRCFIVPIAVEVGNRANSDFTALTLWQNVAIIIKHLDFDDWFCRWTGAGRLFKIIVRKVTAANAIGFGEAIAQ